MLDNDDDLNDEVSQNDFFNGLNLQKINSNIGEQSYELINDKKNTFQSLKAEKDKLLFNFEKNNSVLAAKNELIQAIILKKTNISLLKQALEKSNEKTRKNQEELDVLKNRIAKKKQKLALYQDKIEICKEMVKKSEYAYNNKANNEKDGFNALKVRLIEYEKQRIDELNRFVFDLTEIKPKMEEDILQKSTRTALKDARQTIYVNGRWILANDHVLYKILRSILPSDGDYLTFFRDLQPKDDKSKDIESHQFDDIDEHFPAAAHSTLTQNPKSLWTSTTTPNLLRSISASLNSTHKFINKHAILSGLTYIVQFVNLIAFYLNIVLPYNLPHSKFCTQALKENQFQNAVAKLNTNIVFLSIQQNIQVTNLLPKHTLENLCHFLTNFKEMRIKLRDKHSIAFPSHLIPLLEEMFSDYEDDSGNEAVPLIYNDNEEWETIPNSNEIPSDDSYTNPGPSSRNVIATSSSLISSVFSNFFNKHNTK